MSEYKYPESLKYNKDYSWVKVDGAIASVGIIEASAKKVKEFVFIQLPKKGQKINAGQEYISLEAIKWSGHLSSPVSGEIVEVNDQLFDEPSEINKNPYKNWIMKVKIEDKKELEKLMASNEAKKYYGGE